VTLLLLGLLAVSTVRAISMRHMIHVYEDEMLLGNEGSAKSDIDVDADADDAATNKESDTDEVESPKAMADNENIVKTARLRLDTPKGSTTTVTTNTTVVKAPATAAPSAPAVNTATRGNSFTPNKVTGNGARNGTVTGGPSSTVKGGPSTNLTGNGGPSKNITVKAHLAVSGSGTGGNTSSSTGSGSGPRSSASSLAGSVKDVGVSGTPSAGKFLSKTATSGVTTPAAAAAAPPSQISYTVNIVAANAKYVASGVASKQA